ncbi:conserved membrane protein of unknown function [Tenacibaculum sp. 190130A14a]|uniref:Signal peptide-containing protein n=1 Tax=Tenacibaculum polynesiense TaxID=3137857 RepID=A0ABM9PCL8_9FLAO
MKKAFILCLVIIIATILGSMYGVLHDHITYSISKEYYTKFKFIQFGFEDWGLGQNINTIQSPEIIMNNPRIGVTIVGILATWWVGLIIGIFLSITGLIHSNHKRMFYITMKALFLTLGISLLTSFLGFLYGKLFLLETSTNWYLPNNLIHHKQFVLVGCIHNFSYLGGLVGLLVGIIFSIRQKAKIRIN